MSVQRLAILVRQLQGALGGNRVIRGSVSSAGAVTRGAGFTAAKNATGDYTVTFDVEFDAAPTVVATAEGSGAVAAKVASVAAGSVNVHVFTTTTGSNLDLAFNFVVVG